MTNRFAVVCVAWAAVTLGAGPVPATEHKGPRIEVREERFDLGTVTEGVEAVHLFEFRNAGDEELVIQQVRTS